MKGINPMGHWRRWRATLVVTLALGMLTLVIPARAEPPVRWKMASAFPARLVQLGSLGRSFTAKLERISGRSFVIEMLAPNTLVKPFEMLDAVAEGTVDAAWSTPGYWTDRDPAFALFSSVPFGPDAAEYAAWLYFGGGLEEMDALYRRFGVKSIVCGVIAPEAAGWFRRRIRTVKDLEGLKMRTFGLGAKVLQKLGVVPQLVAVDSLLGALRDGAIDGAEFSMPAIDVAIGFDRVAKHYYFPGWHQQSALLEFMLPRRVWDRLSQMRKAQIEVACGDTFREGLAQGEAIQARALITLQSRGVRIQRLPPEVLNALEKAWNAVASEMAAKSPAFRSAWTSLTRFREEYRVWRELGYLR